MGILLPFTGESELVIMIGVATEETAGSDRVPDLQRLRGEPWLERHLFNETPMALLCGCTLKCVPNLLDTADIVRDACLQQLISGLPVLREGTVINHS